MREYLGLTLIIPDRPDAERDAVASAWTEVGGKVLRLGRFWEPPELDPANVRVYGSETFCLVLAEKLNLTLISPPDDFIRSVPSDLLARRVEIVRLCEALESRFPVFVKPVKPKQFSARVYSGPHDLQEETCGLNPDAPVIRSEVVKLLAEARAFVLDGRVLDASIYEGDAPLPEEFLASLGERVALPVSCVVDAGLIAGAGWAFLEANAVWGAGLNGCKASLVLPCIEWASGPAA